MKTYRAQCIQGGIVVAEVSAPSFAQAEREIMHYASMYVFDGPVLVKLPRTAQTAPDAPVERSCTRTKPVTPKENSEMSPFKQYRRTQIAEMRPYIQGEVWNSRVSVSAPDREAGSPKLGDMIARNPKNHDDQWLIAAQYFADNFESAPVERFDNGTRDDTEEKL